MVTVMELLSHPSFSDDFRLISGRSGLYNTVRDSGIFEWENEEVIEKSFHIGDFVVTTLAAQKDDPENAKKYMKLLIKRKLAALCIKDVYFKEIPEEIIKLADDYQVPLFLFSNTYFDEIIFAVKSSLTPDDINSKTVNKIRRILYENMNDLEKEITIKEINPYFHRNVACAFCLPRNIKKKKNITEEYFSHYTMTLSPRAEAEEFTYSIVKFPWGIALIFTGGIAGDDLIKELKKFIDSLQIDQKKFAIGVSRAFDELLKLGTALREALYASVDCALNKKNITDYGSGGLTQFLCPLRDNYWTTDFYEQMLRKISDYDKKHKSNFMNTLTVYVHCGGDIAETAEKTFQHSNTIRYRMDKIMNILGISNSEDRITQLYIFVRLHEVKEYLDNIRI